MRDSTRLANASQVSDTKGNTPHENAEKYADLWQLASVGQPRTELVFHPGARLARWPQEKMPAIGSDWLGPFFRTLDDLSPSATLNGIDPALIAQSGYKVCKRGYNGRIAVPANSVIVPCRNPAGSVVALQTGVGRWITVPQVHVTNLIRRNWTNRLEFFATVVEADAAAHSRNIAAVVLNGVPLEQLSKRLLSESYEIVDEWRCAA